MNKFKFSILIGACAIMATACEDKLDEPQKGVVSYENFYQTDEDAQNAVNGMYDVFAKAMTNANNVGIQNAMFFTFNLCADDLYAAGEFFGDNDFMAQLNEFRHASDHECLTNAYKAFYNIIYAANLVINNVGATEMTDVKKRCIAEARVIRAYCHMMLASVWFDPPKIEKVLTGSETIENADHKELLTWCGDECMEVVGDLPERNGAQDKDGTVKVTKGFAQFVAGKSYMFAGEFDKSKSALKPLVESTNYALVPSDRIGETFRAAGDGNEEQIMATNISVNKAVGTWSGMIQRSVWMYSNIMNWRLDHMAGAPEEVYNGWGGLGIRADWSADFIANDGENSARRKAWIKSIDEVMYEMSYGDNDLKDGKPMTRAEKESDPNRGIRTFLYGQTLYLEYKRQFLKDEIYPGEAFPTRNTLLARLGEAYLLYAEACARTNDNDGLKYLNAIQNRAQSQTVSSNLTLDAVKQEKRFEMWLEGCRWPDMVRWREQDNDASIFDKIKENGKTVPKLYDAFFDANGEEDGTGTKESKHRFYTYDTHPNVGECGFTNEAKFKYFPIPFSETQVNPNIKQHEGWTTAESAE
jgi:hypothetical protein